MEEPDMSHEELRLARKRTIGIKQTIKALEKNVAKAIFIASDAEDHVVTNLKEMCKAKGVAVYYIETMAQLGQLCGIEVGAAAAAIITD